MCACLLLQPQNLCAGHPPPLDGVDVPRVEGDVGLRQRARELLAHHWEDLAHGRPADQLPGREVFFVELLLHLGEEVLVHLEVLAVFVAVLLPVAVLGIADAFFEAGAEGDAVGPIQHEHEVVLVQAGVSVLPHVLVVQCVAVRGDLEKALLRCCIR